LMKSSTTSPMFLFEWVHCPSIVNAHTDKVCRMHFLNTYQSMASTTSAWLLQTFCMSLRLGFGRQCLFISFEFSLQPMKHKSQSLIGGMSWTHRKGLNNLFSHQVPRSLYVWSRYNPALPQDSICIA
jgi:hypothetical protein